MPEAPAQAGAGGLLSSVSDYISQNPRITRSLLAGLGTAAVGGGLTAFGRGREGESKGKRRWRILRNALLMGAAGAGAYGLTSYGAGQLATADPGTDDELIDPIANWTTGLLGAGAGVGAASTATNNLRRNRAMSLNRLAEVGTVKKPGEVAKALNRNASGLVGGAAPVGNIVDIAEEWRNRPNEGKGLMHRATLGLMNTHDGRKADELVRRLANLDGLSPDHQANMLKRLEQEGSLFKGFGAGKLRIPGTGTAGPLTKYLAQHKWPKRLAAGGALAAALYGTHGAISGLSGESTPAINTAGGLFKQ